MSTELITVTILKWEKHNSGKKDGHTKMLVKTNLRDNPKLLLASYKARLLYLWLLMKSGEDTRATIQYIPSQSRAWTGLKPSEHSDALASLVKNQLLTVENSPAPSLKEEKRKEKKVIPDETKTPPAEFDFETCRKEYPIKDGGEIGIKRLRARDWDLETCQAFARAVRKYRSECKAKRVDQKFIMHFKNFVGDGAKEPWRDYYDPPKPPPTPPKPEPINEPPFDPIDVSKITNAHAKKLLSLVTGGVPMDATGGSHG